MAHDVLISYSSHDKLQADAVCNRLESKGIRCWIAPRDVPLGTEYADSIVQAIESARVIVLIYSTHADESHQVRREVERAVSNGIAIIPVRIENAAMSEAFQYYVGSMHWLDAITPPFESHIDKLALDLTALLSKGDKARSGADRNGPADTGRAGGTMRSAEAAPQSGGASPATVPSGSSAGAVRQMPAAGMQAAESPPTKPRGAVYAAVGALVVAIAGGAGYYAFLRPAAGVVVPAVARATQDEATGRLTKVNLAVAKVVEEKHSELDYPFAIRTSPEAGQAAARTTAVTLYISGMEMLPDLKNQPQQDAAARLESLGFKVKVQERSDAADAGKVLGMDPGPGSRALRGTDVTLVVSGSKVAVPDVIGKPLAEAERHVSEAKLKSTVARDWRLDKALGTVFDAEPGPGSNLNPGDVVKLRVAAPGGWVYLEAGRRATLDSVLKMPSPGRLRERANSNGRVLGVAQKGQSVRVLEAPGDGWTKVVLVD